MSPTTSISPEKSVRLIGGKDICVGRRCRESSPVVYFGSDQQVGEGFANALQIMGLDTSFLPVGIVLATNAPNTEDD